MTEEVQVQEQQQQEIVDQQQTNEQPQQEDQQQAEEPVQSVQQPQEQEYQQSQRLSFEQISRSINLGDFQDAVNQESVKAFAEQFGEVENIKEQIAKESQNKCYIVTFKNEESVSNVFSQCGYHCNIENQDVKIKLIKNPQLKIALRYIDKNLDEEMIANVLREFIREQNPDKQVPVFTCQFSYKNNEKTGANLQLINRDDFETILSAVNKIEFDQKLVQKAFQDKEIKIVNREELEIRKQLKKPLCNEGEFLQIIGEIFQEKQRVQQRPFQQRNTYQHYDNHYQGQPRFQYQGRPYQQKPYQQRPPYQQKPNTNKYPEENSVYVTNMPQSTPKEELENIFPENNRPVEIYFKKQRDSNKNYCSAVCYFDTPEKAKAVLNKEYQIRDRPVHVKENRRNEIRQQQFGGYDRH